MMCWPVCRAFIRSNETYSLSLSILLKTQMIKFFSGLYEWLLGSPQPPQETLVYRDVIFPNAGLFMLGFSLAMVLVYYYVLNRALNTGFYRTSHWVMVLF